MKIVYSCSNCSDEKYVQLFKNRQCMVLQQAQKYHALLSQGIRKNGADVDYISGLPINRSVSGKLFFKREKEKKDGIAYYYYRFVNLPIIRQVFVFLESYFTASALMREAAKNGEKCACVCDILNIANFHGVTLAARRKKVKIYGIITDVPGHFASSPKKGFAAFLSKIKDRINMQPFARLDGYLVLTSAMNDLLNKKNLPSVVIEGQVDGDIKAECEEPKKIPRAMIYAGTLDKKYGIEKLVKAFAAVQNHEWTLEIYGDGNFKDELVELAKTYNNVVYKGVALNAEIVKAEQKASLLVNPRPSGEEFTKYSFPSKNMEYMASGTPLITTNLPGMPAEYREYVYLFDETTEDSFASSLKAVMAKSPDELRAKGAAAKKFVLENKNNVVQAAKILKLIEENL